MRIFENCRFFNQPNSSIMKSAESLENFFSQKLSHLRERVKPQAKQSCRLCKLSMQELMQWNQFQFFGNYWSILAFLSLFWLFLMYKCTIEIDNYQPKRRKKEIARERKDLKRKKKENQIMYATHRYENKSKKKQRVVLNLP